MTNKKRGGKKHNKNENLPFVSIRTLPFVSICTPTFNRRPFISHMIKCFEHQDYPKNKMEWIIIDDGTDKIEDLVSHIPQVKYFKYDNKMTLGKKRNLMHDKTQGEILVYMDDDDYYPPDRVSHAVNKLLKHPSAMCAGSSELYIYFKHINKMYQFGPYGDKHATAGTFAFRRKLLDETRYEDYASIAEEKAFLKNYTIPFVQLDPLKSILVFSHQHNTFDKKKLLDNPDPRFTKESDKTVEMFIKDPEMRNFYMNEIEELLKDYNLGHPRMKPDVLEQIIKIEETRRKLSENVAQHYANQVITISQNGGPSKKLTFEETLHFMRQQQQHIHNLTEQLKGKDIEINIVNEERNKERARLIKHIEELSSKLLYIGVIDGSNIYYNNKNFSNLTTENIEQLCIA